MAKGASSLSKTAVWILLGLLILGLAGFGATSFSGGTRAVATVGSAEVRTDAYVRALQNELRTIQAQRGAPFSIADAQAQGVTDRVLSRLILAAALEHEADAAGLSVGDARVAQDLAQIPSFQGPDGSFNPEAYEFALRSAGMRAADFEADLRAESAATLLQAGVLSGITMPEVYIDTILTHALETRDVTWVQVPQGAFALGAPVPTEAEITAFYEANIDRYTSPRTKHITYAWLTPEMILDTVEVDTDTLRAAYEERADEFNQPERRLVERLVFSSDAAAQEALARVAAGEAGFEDLVEERELDLADTDMGDLTRADLGDAAEAVFAADVGDVVAAPSPLGTALYRVNGILSARETSFEDAQPALRDLLVLDRARRVIANLVQGFDDELAAGATLEDMAQGTDMQLGEIAWTGRESEGIAGYDAFRAAAEAVTIEDFPEIAGLGDDDGLFALRLDRIDEAAPIPLAEIRDRVTADWEADARTTARLEAAQAAADAIADGADFADRGLPAGRSETGLSRGARLADLPQSVSRAAFALSQPGEAQAVRQGQAVFVVRLDAINPADLDSPGARQLAQEVRNEAAGSVANDLFRALATDIQTRAGVSVDEAALSAVHATLQ